MFILMREAAVLLLVVFSYFFSWDNEKINIFLKIKTWLPNILEGQYVSPEPRMGVFD